MNEFDRLKDFPAVGYQEVDVCVPVTVKPFANVLAPKIKCVGTPVVCAGEGECKGNCGNVCKFTISQKIKVEIPVIFGAKAEVISPQKLIDEIKGFSNDILNLYK